MDQPSVMPDLKPHRRRDFPGGSVQVFGDTITASQAAAAFISEAIRTSVAARGRVTIGLATGSTPIPIYGRLVSFHKSGELSFGQVSTFNLDEYYPISPLDPQSYRSYMHRHLFSSVDLPPNQAHVLDGTVPESALDDHAADFDRWIACAGGLDFQLLGIGRNGHIGFNEPSIFPVEQALTLPTRVVDLHPTTIADAVKDFGSEDAVPRRALTMGTASILASRSILVLAFGANKAEAVGRSLRGPITSEVPGSLLQSVADRVTWMIDGAAGADLF